MTRNSKPGRVDSEHETHGFQVNSRANITACSINHIISNLVRILMRSSSKGCKKEMKIHKQDAGHMTKLAAMPIYTEFYCQRNFIFDLIF